MRAAHLRQELAPRVAVVHDLPPALLVAVPGGVLCVCVWVCVCACVVCVCVCECTPCVRVRGGSVWCV